METDADKILPRSAKMNERDLELGALGRQFFAADGWRRLGYASATQYARERLGMSYSALKGYMTLSRRMVFKPAVERALRDGRIGLHAAGPTKRWRARCPRTWPMGWARVPCVCG